MKFKINITILILNSIFFIGCIQEAKQHEEKINRISLSDEMVPNQTTAIRVAEAIWLQRYGNSIYNMKPFSARLKEGDSSVWIVEGTLPKGMKGGVPYIEIQKNDCKVKNVSHGK